MIRTQLLLILLLLTVCGGCQFDGPPMPSSIRVVDGETMKPLGGALVLIFDPISEIDWLGHGQVSELRATGDGLIAVKAIKYDDIQNRLMIAKPGYFAADLYSVIGGSEAGYWYVRSPTVCYPFCCCHDPEFREEFRREDDAVKLTGWPPQMTKAVTTDKRHSQDIVVPLYRIRTPTTATAKSQ